MEEGDVPDDLQPPELLPGLSEWYDDFRELSTDRQIGWSEGPIPASSIDRHTANWSHEDAEMFRACIRAMDDVWRDRGKTPEPTTPGQGNAARDAFRSAFGGRK